LCNQLKSLFNNKNQDYNNFETSELLNALKGKKNFFVYERYLIYQGKKVK